MIVERAWGWAEVGPASVGMDPALTEAASRCAEDRLGRQGGAGQLVVLRRGEVVLDRAFAALPRSLFLIYSASKPYVALLVHLLAEMSLLSLDEPIAEHWPRFARHGKGRITPRHVLQHRAGVPLDRSPRAIASMVGWEAAVRAMEELRPEASPPARLAYHALTFGFILGELVRRVSGQPVEAFLRRSFLDPLGLADTHLGLPDRFAHRGVPVVPAGGPSELANSVIFNRRSVRRAVIPAASISATARDVARFYETLRRGGELAGTRVLAAHTVAEACRVSSDGEMDGTIKRPVRWAQGFHLGGVHGPRDIARVMGDLSRRTAFGHNGNVCCTGWADPERELSFAYLTNLLMTTDEGVLHHGLVADCILRACDTR